MPASLCLPAQLPLTPRMHALCLPAGRTQRLLCGSSLSSAPVAVLLSRRSVILSPLCLLRLAVLLPLPQGVHPPLHLPNDGLVSVQTSFPITL